MSRCRMIAAVALAVLAAGPAGAGDHEEGWNWLAETDRVETQGIFWNDRFGDRKDRWKTGGITQSYIFPEHMFGENGWFADRAPALEVNARALVITPDNTSNTRVDPNDRAYAQYAAVGLYLRSIARPRTIAPGVSVQTEDRAGVEIGWLGDPLPLFDFQESMHALFGTGGDAANLENALNAGLLANVEGRRSWRFRYELGRRDVEAVPFVQASAGMREVSVRAGADFFVGSALEGRTWGADLSTGAVIAGA